MAAATAADVVVRELHRFDQLQAARRLFEQIWRPAGGDPPPIGGELLRALGHFFSAWPERGLHSHITGVAPGGQHRGVGFALKVHQRAWAMARGLDLIGWTFDPLVARNAWFNLSKLGAVPTGYLEDFYGPMTDAINAGMASDRLLLACQPRRRSPRLRQPRQPPPVPAEEALAVGRDLEPVVGATDAEAVTVAVPPDVEALGPERRRAWRRAVRQVLGGRLAGGATVTAFLRHPDRYVVERSPPAGGDPEPAAGPR